MRKVREAGCRSEPGRSQQTTLYSLEQWQLKPLSHCSGDPNPSIEAERVFYRNSICLAAQACDPPAGAILHNPPPKLAMQSQNEAHGQHEVTAAKPAIEKWVYNLHGVPPGQTLPREAVGAVGAKQNKL